MIQKYQNQVLVNQLKKHISTMQQGFQKMLADEEVEGLNDTELFRKIIELEDTTCIASPANEQCEFAREYLRKYFNVEFKDASHNVKSILGSREGAFPSAWTFSDGAAIWFDEFGLEDPSPNDVCEQYKATHNSAACDESFIYYVDVNGKKGPNSEGRDVYCFTVDARGRVFSCGIDFENWHDDPSLCGEAGKPITEDLDATNCAARIIENGWKMDY